MRICIAVASAGTCQDEMAFSLARMAYHQGKAGHELDLLGVSGAYIDDNMNELYHMAQKGNYDWLFVVETDMNYLLPGDILDFMIKQGKDVLSGVYYQGSFPFRPILYNFTAEGFIRNLGEIPEGTFKIESSGTGWLLLSKKVLQAFTPEVMEKYGAPFDYLFEGNKLKLRHDAAFFWRLKQLGVESWACSDIPLRHMKKHGIGPEHFNTAKSMIEKGIYG